jgi:hypothetical protein
MTKRILFLCVLLLVGTALFAQGENLTLKAAVMGPGDQLYFWWGHIALIIEDSDTGINRFYDYGIFSFNSDNFFLNFAFGRLLYSCGVSLADRSFSNYIYTNRDIVTYTLDLPPETRLKVKNFADVNVLPENRDYFYHHFRDNCSTRIRDIIDLATDGQFREQFEQTQSRFTYREQVRRHTWFSPLMDWLLNFWMGQVIDTKITVWEDMFIPSEVAKRIEDFWYTDVNGERRKLVSSVDIINVSNGRPPVLDEPRKQWPRELAFSLVLSAIFGLFCLMRVKGKKSGVVLSGITMSLAGLIFGTASLLLYFMNIFTNHDYTFQNLNMLFGTPLLLASFPLGLCYALTRNPGRFLKYDALLRLVWLLAAAGVLVSMLIKIFPAFYQQNLTDQMLFLPISLAFAFQPVGLKEVYDKYLRRKNA